MKRWVAVLFVVAAGLLSALSGSMADWSLLSMSSERVAFRAYVGATVQQYDTLSVPSGHRAELVNFTLYADDSAQANGVLNIHFVSAVTKTPYLRLTQGPFSANQIVTTTWQGPWVFPKDSTILVYYNITAATPATLDTMRAHATWRADFRR